MVELVNANAEQGVGSAPMRRLCAVLLALLLVPAMLVAPVEALRRETLTLQTAAGSHVIDIEVAESKEDKAQGLMHRSSLPDNGGMLFVNAAPREIIMWMKNTLIPLDMVFIRADGVVHRIEAGTEPYSETIIRSNGDVLGVLELNAGTAQRLGLKPGDHAVHAAFQPR